MTEQHPITPPPELVQEWCLLPLSQDEVLVIAAQWGADRELDACCALLAKPEFALTGRGPNDLRAGRRPKPLSLKKQALALIDGCTDPEGDYLDDNALSAIRRALEALPDA